LRRGLIGSPSTTACGCRCRSVDCSGPLPAAARSDRPFSTSRIGVGSEGFFRPAGIRPMPVGGDLDALSGIRARRSSASTRLTRRIGRPRNRTSSAFVSGSGRSTSTHRRPRRAAFLGLGRLGLGVAEGPNLSAWTRCALHVADQSSWSGQAVSAGLFRSW